MAFKLELPNEKCKCNGAEQAFPAAETGVTNRELVCRSCIYKIRGDSAKCVKFDPKPEAVLQKGECTSFLPK